MPRGKKTKGPKPKTRVHVGKALLGLGVVAVLGSTPNDLSGGDAPLTKLEYAQQAADDGNWWDPDTGVVANVGMATEGLAGNLVSVEGAVVVGGAWGLWEVAKASGIGRRAIIKTGHHAIGM